MRQPWTCVCSVRVSGINVLECMMIVTYAAGKSSRLIDVVWREKQGRSVVRKNLYTCRFPFATSIIMQISCEGSGEVTSPTWHPSCQRMSVAQALVLSGDTAAALLWFTSSRASMSLLHADSHVCQRVMSHAWVAPRCQTRRRSTCVTQDRPLTSPVCHAFDWSAYMHEERTRSQPDSPCTAPLRMSAR